MEEIRSGGTTVLLLDDDRQFLEIFQRALLIITRGKWEVLTACSADEGWDILRRTPLNMLAFEMQMAGLGGLQFVHDLHREFPNLIKVVLTTMPDEVWRVAYLNAGVDCFLPKPQQLAKMREVALLLEELGQKRPAEEGFHGILRRVGLLEVVQMMCLSGLGVVMEINSRSMRGSIHIRNGTVVHAECSGQRGMTALAQLLELQGGAFTVTPSTAPPEVTIAGPWEWIVMEASRLKDEKQHSGISTS
jgi:ActR/RegA family two-component response regulator